MIFYYDKNYNIYNTQIEAAEAEIKTGEKCHFYYYDDEFKKVDWLNEPTESLPELYKRRAEYIRDNYEYVILCFSGGHDSSQMLETFYYNNIHIDEILCVGAFSQDKFFGSDENHNREIYINTKEVINQYNFPNTKKTYIDYTDYFNDPNNFTLINKYGNEWTKYIGGYKSVHNLFWYDMKKFVGKDNNKKTAWLMGADKTKLNFFMNKYCVHFNDMQVTDYGCMYKDENFERVNFYTDVHPTATDIIKKQAHILKRYYKLYDEKIPKGVDRTDIYHKLYYDLKHPVLYASKKSPYSTISLRDMFMLNATDSGMYNMFIEGLETIKKVTSPSNKLCFFTRNYMVE